MSNNFIATFQAERRQLIIDHYQNGRKWEDDHPAEWKFYGGDGSSYSKPGLDKLRSSEDFLKIVTARKLDVVKMTRAEIQELLWDEVIWVLIEKDFKDLIFLKSVWRQAFDYLCTHDYKQYCHVVSPLCIVKVYEESDYPWGTTTVITGGRVFDVSINFSDMKLTIMKDDENATVGAYFVD
jgi:hypothetical protein